MRSSVRTSTSRRSRSAAAVCWQRSSGLATIAWLLRSPDDQRVPQVDVLLAATLRCHPFGVDHGPAPKDQGRRHHPEIAQRPLDEGLAEDADDADRHRTGHHQPGEAELRVGRSDLRGEQPADTRPDQFPEVPKEVDNHREDGTELDDRGETGDADVVDIQAEQFFGHREMPRTRDRDELGESLHHPEDAGLQQVHAPTPARSNASAAVRMASMRPGWLAAKTATVSVVTPVSA